MRPFLFPLFFILLTFSPLLADSHTSQSKESKTLPATRFIRIEENNDYANLQTAITTYQKDEVNVTLIGAIHIADPSYYKSLNTLFIQYESLLFEMVGGEKKDEQTKEEKDGLALFLGNAYTIIAKFLNLQGQKEGIDYSAKNFVHADLSMEDFRSMQKEKGESLLSFAIQQNKMNKANKMKQPNPQKLLEAFLQGKTNLLKLELIHTLNSTGNNMMGEMLGQTVIIGERNAKCLKVLAEMINKGQTHIGIFYGSAHYPDMEKRLLQQGFKKTAQNWLTAWHIPKN